MKVGCGSIKKRINMRMGGTAGMYIFVIIICFNFDILGDLHFTVKASMLCALNESTTLVVEHRSL